jgi:hypothetical protein
MRSGNAGERFSNRLLIAAGLAMLVLFVAPLFFHLVERHRSDDVHNVGDAYGWVVRTLFEGTSPCKVKSQLGFLAYWTVRVAGVSVVAFTGSQHLLICGWSPKGFEIIRELRAKEVEDRRDIVILADHSNSSDDPDDLDARSLLTTLAIEFVNPDACSCVEVVKSENRPARSRGGADRGVAIGGSVR